LAAWSRERTALERAAVDDDFVYFVDFENIGGLVSDVDGDEEFVMIPAEIWRRNSRAVSKLLIRDKAIASIEVDPRRETADADFSNNHYPGRIDKSRLELYKGDNDAQDMMADMLRTLRTSKGGNDESEPVPLEPAGN
jgi:hypothetical protein